MRNRSSRRRRGLAICCGSVALLACAPLSTASAEESREAGRRVSFRVESAREVANDWVRAVVGITAENADSAKLADEVNRAMAWALEQASRAKGVEPKSGGYHTHPVHEDGRLRRWRASQDLILESADPKALTELVGALQSRLQLRSFEFSVSPGKQREVEEELVVEVLAAFRARAELVRENLGAGGYEIDQVSIDTGGHSPPVVMRHMEARTMSAVAPPAVEGGSSRLTVAVNGSIVLE